jgi:hypothetical protein
VAQGDDETRLADPSAVPPKGGNYQSEGAGGSHRSRSSGWSATTSDIDHGRFAPGSILDQRYRVVGRLGKGGMGEIITTIFVVTIGWVGLLATIATLTTRFLLLRAPLTWDFSSWRAPAGIVYLLALLSLGAGGAWPASRPVRHA